MSCFCDACGVEEDTLIDVPVQPGLMGLRIVPGGPSGCPQYGHRIEEFFTSCPESLKAVLGKGDVITSIDGEPTGHLDDKKVTEMLTSRKDKFRQMVVFKFKAK